ncbi:MAG: penicillin-insensitive murein endopeptidase, partial [Myxococcales bacterium]|nr:penicillin-insensitive murein endopeptidase [Myxococcales bacterium]
TSGKTSGKKSSSWRSLARWFVMGSCSAFLASAAVTYAFAELYLRASEAAASDDGVAVLAEEDGEDESSIDAALAEPLAGEDDAVASLAPRDGAASFGEVLDGTDSLPLQVLATLDASGSEDPEASTASILDREHNTVDGYRVGDELRPGLTLEAIGRQRVILRLEDGSLRSLQLAGAAPLVLAEGPTPGIRARIYSGPLEALLAPVSAGGVGVGGPNGGRLVNAVQLPENPQLYTRKHPANAWGSTHTITALQRSVARFRKQSGYQGAVVIGDISKRHGGRFYPHKSHQSGRDVDIALPGSPGARDWDATWGLVRALIDSDRVERIFLDYGRQSELYEAARRVGESTESLARELQFPEGRYAPAIVQHQSGHEEHIHVRFKCGPDERGCTGVHG